MQSGLGQEPRGSTSSGPLPLLDLWTNTGLIPMGSDLDIGVATQLLHEHVREVRNPNRDASQSNTLRVV